MINLKKIIEKTSYIIINNKLFIRGNNKFIRVKQKLPEYINDIDELDNYDFLYKKKQNKTKTY